MEIRIFLLFFFLTLVITDDTDARRIGSSSSRSPVSHHSSSGRIWSRPIGHSSSDHRSGSNYNTRPTSSGGHTQSRPFEHGSSSNGHTAGSNYFGHGTSSGGYTTGSSPSGHGTSSGGHATGLNPIGHGSASSQTSHRLNKDSSTSLLHAEGGGAIRPPQSNTAQPSIRPSAPYGNTGTYSGRETGKPITDSKQNSAPYNPSAPPSHDLSKSTVIPSQNQGSSFGQPNTPFNQPHGNVPHNNPSWSNPHFNPGQSYPPISTTNNIGFKDSLRQPSMSHPPFAPSHPSYPTPNFNQHSPPYPVHSFNHANQPHPAYNPSHSVPGHTIGHPSSYPSHIAPPVPGTFGNPYSTHPVGSTHGTIGQSYYPQQHVLAQPAAQPYIPGQTVIMVPNQQNNGRGFGQMVKEALVFSTINAGVNRLLNPHHHYISDSRPLGAGATPSETHITYNNQYFNTAPSNISPAAPNTFQGNAPNTNPAGYPNSVYNPSITPGVMTSANVINNDTVTNFASNPSVNTMDTTNSMGSRSILTTNGPAGTIPKTQATSDKETTINYPQYRISDNELWMLTEELFAKQEIDVSKYLTLHLQSMAVSQNVTDEASRPLIYLQEEIYDHPTILAIRALYDNYEHDSTIKESRTLTKRKEEEFLLDVFLNTNVMARAMQWLSDLHFIAPDDFERKDILRHIWFNQFDGTTSGFERIFTSERYGSELIGVQDWIYFEYQESKKRIDYFGYVDSLKLGDRASLLKLNFQMDGIIRPNATIFVGTLPELEMSLYTICFYARPNNLCPVSLGGSKFNIFTHSFRYYGKDLIDLALPIF